MNKRRRNELRKWSERFESLRLRLQIIAEDEAASLLNVPYPTNEDAALAADTYNELDNIQNEIESLRGRVDEIVNHR